MLSRSSVARALVLVLGLGIVTAACGQYSISNLRALNAFKNANALYTRGDFAAAAAQYEECFTFNPEFKGITHFFIANSYDQLYKPTRKGEPANDAYMQKAIEHYRLAIAKIKDDDAPTASDVRKRAYEYLLAAYRDKLKDFSQAEPVAQEMIKYEPNEPTNYQQLARLYAETGRYEEAEAMFIKSTEVKPNDPQVYSALATFYNDQGQFEKTMVALNRRADAEPKNPEAWHTIGTYYSDKVYKDTRLPKTKQAEYTLAGIEAENKALALNPEYVDALVYKGILLRIQAGLETTNAAKRSALMKEAEDIKAKWTELQKKQAGGAAAPTKKGGE
jgi:tetratricopeptide (TPR) repeat protein